MLPFLDLFGLQIPTYGLTAVLAAVMGCFFILARFRKFGYPKDEWAGIVTYILIGVLAGSKILYFITVWKDLVSDIGQIPFKEFAERYITGGLVFYGGLIGAVIAVLLYSKVRKYPLSRLTMTLVPSIPLIHGIARIGCFLAGCCGGNIFGLPIQLVESGLLFVLFFILYRVCNLNYRHPIGLGLYLSIYAISRFILEFFRNDPLRGFVGPLSTSQFISCFILPLGLLLIFFSDRIFNALDRFTTKGAVPSEPSDDASSDVPHENS